MEVLAFGQKQGGTGAQQVALPITDDGTALVVSGSTSSGAATSAKQDTGNTSLASLVTHQADGTQKTQIVDGSGNVAPAGDTVGRASIVKVTDGTSVLGTASNPFDVKLGAERTTYTIPFARGALDLSGSVLTTDSNPTNGASVDPSLTFRLTTSNLSAIGSTATLFSGDALGQGGTISLQPWFYDDVRDKWFQYLVGAAVACGNWTSIGTVGGGFLGAKMFMQITANSSNWKAFYLLIR